MTPKFYNTLTRSLETFEPLSPTGVGVYTCGPTVYHHAHLGNLRTYIASDVLVRVLRLTGHEVKHVMNITDVGHLVSDEDEGEDKMAVGAAREGITAWEIAERYSKSFFEQCALLNIATPTVVCRATKHIAQQIAMVQALEDRGCAYRTDDGMYFDTSRDPSYGQLARLDIEGLKAGARVEVGKKRNKTDFALWKFSRPGENRQMEWESPWGKGFPGWHIECSAMSTHYLGTQFDIHTGGIDHIPVHHSNEIAQSECATGDKPFVRFWLHSNFLQMADAERMAKSSGDFLTVFKLCDKGYDPLAFRLFCLRAHYRSPLKFSWESLDGVAVAYKRLRSETSGLASKITDEELAAVEGAAPHEAQAAYEQEILSALCNDLATPTAMTALQRAVEDQALPPACKLAIVKRFDAVFALDLLTPVKEEDSESLDSEIEAMLADRERARSQKDWASSDRLRRELEAQGYIVKDTPEGQKVQRK